MKKTSELATILIVIFIVKVNGKYEFCQDSSLQRPLGCPEIVCQLINNRQTDFCSTVECMGIEPTDCPKLNASYVSKLTMCGCCPGCAKYQDENETCEVSPQPPSHDATCVGPICPILMNECKPGLECKYLGENSKKCAVPETVENAPPPGTQETDCEYKRNLASIDQLHWIPVCDKEGFYAPKQCKPTGPHNGICFCVDKFGNRIFGREWRSKAQNQTCECSRRVHGLRNLPTDPKIATLHCSADGNYEPLQCDTDSGLCYCVDPMTGKLDGSVVPEDQWKLLPCFSLNVTNGDPTGQYLRLCESEWASGQRIRKEGFLHGVDVYAVVDYNCDYDGSFAPKHRFQSQHHCVPKSGIITQNDGKYGFIDQFPRMDCQCFRDAILYKEEDTPFTKDCDTQTGNYGTTSQNDENQYQCVDKDGFFYGGSAPENFRCCLLGTCNGEPCYDPVTKEGTYKKCLDI